MTMQEPRRVAVIDIGKTNVKVAVVDTKTLEESSVRKIPNTVLMDGPYPHFDVEGQWQFILASLQELHSAQPFDAISITAHGASAALVKSDGILAMPVLDYEYAGPDELTLEYDRVRPVFSETYSARLPMGLNVGAQLFWQQARFPLEFARADHVLGLSQYWAMHLTDVAASEATALGCHTDLWNPAKADYSSMVAALGWRRLFPPLRSAFDALAMLKPDIAKQIGANKPLPVHCGIHDSNASLLPHLLSRASPFSVVSTGTWVIVLSVGGDLEGLDPRRDCLANSDAFACPVASARFMGGREYETIVPIGVNGTDESLSTVLDETILLLPSVEQTSGAFPARKMQWQSSEPQGAVRASTASLYLAMMTATSLSLTGAKGDIIVEGPFTKNQSFLEMLNVATGRAVIAMTGSSTGTSVGAALLALGKDHHVRLGDERRIIPTRERVAGMQKWRDAWLAAVATPV